MNACARLTAGRRLVAVLATDIAGLSLCPHSTRSIVDGAAPAFQLQEIHERIRERLAVRIPFAKPFVPATTLSRHGFAIVPNLTRGLIPTGLDQIWVADITYVRLAEGFVYLAAILDAFSRKVIGWAIADHLEASLAIEALDMALEARNPPPDSLIHHSDRGVQYACGAYQKRLEKGKIAASMSRVGNPYDNAKAESFMKTLKTEEVDAKTYRDLDDARRQIGAFIETVYNAKRLHSALGYKPPVEFEADLRRDDCNHANQEETRH